MTPEVLVAVVGAVGLILSGVLVELVRTRRRADTVAADTRELRDEVNPPAGFSMRDILGDIRSSLRDLEVDQRDYSRRLLEVERVVAAQFWRGSS